MKTLYTILIFFFGLLLSSEKAHAQTITKTVDKTSVYIGEEFTYTIAIDNLNNLSQLDKIVDDFGPEIDILSVTYSNALHLLQTWGFCNMINYTTNGNILEVLFDGCSGSTNMSSRISIDVTVKLNHHACNLTQKTNTAELRLKNSTVVTDSVDVLIDNSNPFVFQKSFFKYDGTTEQLFYDVRLSSKSGNFYALKDGTERFKDVFTIPNCFQNLSPNDIEVVYIENENDRTTETPVPHTSQISGNQLIAEWQLPSGFQNTNNSSILFAVKVKLSAANCQCNSFFDLENKAFFDFDNVCGIPFSMADEHKIDEGVTCDIENSLPGGCELTFNKTYELDGNDMGLTMKGCRGEYKILVENCTTNMRYNKVHVTDSIPSDLEILSIDSGGFTLTRNGNQLSFFKDQMNPGDIELIKIKFEVKNTLPDHLIENCADIKLFATNIFTNYQKTITQSSCTNFRTVPNQVTVVTRKSICSEDSRNCGSFSKYTYLPDDEVEYELFFYNYGNADGTHVNIEDRLPRFLDVRSVEVYKSESGKSERIGSCTLADYTNITREVRINHNRNNNHLNIDMRNHILDAFTCNGVSFYKIKIKGHITQDVISEDYVNQFVVNYKDQSLRTVADAVSNPISYSVDLEELIMIGKQRTEHQTDCENKTQKITYRIMVANMGSLPVNIDIEDIIPNIANVSIVQGSHNFRSCLQIGAPNPTICSPNSPASFNGTFSTTQNGFRLIKEKLNPCTMLIIEYDVTFDTHLLTKNEVVQACNQMKVWAYTGNIRVRQTMYQKNPDAYPNNIIVNNQPVLNEMYINATSAEEQRQIIQLIKEYKNDPKQFSRANGFNLPNQFPRNPRPRPTLNGRFFGVDEGSACADLQDCLKDFPIECIESNGNNAINFEITSINSSTGEIGTRLTNNTSNKISKVEYILTDVTHEAIMCVPIYIRTRPFGCGPCTGNITAEFRPKDNTSLGGLNLAPNNYAGIAATYKEQNTVVYGHLGAAANISTVNKNFMFPVIKNCSAHFKFSITAVVYFENCETCFTTDAMDFRTSFNPLIDVYNPTRNFPNFPRIPN